MSHRPFKIQNKRSRRAAAFTLVEVLVSLTVLVILLMISAQVIGTVQSTWTTSNARVSQFREARTAFDIITRNLSQATLNTYIDYERSYLTAGGNTASGNDTNAPRYYVRKSDLQFVCGPAANLLQNGGSAGTSPGHAIFFQAPLGVTHTANYAGLDRLLCGRGYFVQYTSDEFFLPPILPATNPRYRYRLMEFSPPAEENMIYSQPPGEGDGVPAWCAQAGIEPTGEESAADHGLTRPIADNIVALIISPLSEGQNNEPVPINGSYAYNSAKKVAGAGNNNNNVNNQGTQHLLPPLVKVVLVAIDEKSADRIAQSSGSGASNPPFSDSISNIIDSSDPANLNETVERIGEELAKFRVNYRMFSATIALRGAKWGN